MRRVLILASLGLLTLAALLTSDRWMAERARVTIETRFSRLLGTRVTVGEARIHFRQGLFLEARDIAAWPGPDGSALEVERAAARLDPSRSSWGVPDFAGWPSKGWSFGSSEPGAEGSLPGSPG